MGFGLSFQERGWSS